MTEEQADYYEMLKRMQTYLHRNRHITIALPRFEMIYPKLVEAIAEIGKVMKLSEAVSIGFAESRTRIRKSLVERGADVARRVEAFAIVKNKSDLMNAVGYKESDLERSSDRALPDRIKIILGYSTPHLKELGPFGVTKESLKDLEENLKDFVLIKSVDGQMEEQYRHLSVEVAVENAVSYLRKIDTIIAIFDLTDSDFIRNYKIQREIGFVSPSPR